MRVQTVSSLRNPGNLMRAGMHILTTQVNSLRDYCGVTTGNPTLPNYSLQQQFHDLRHSPEPMSSVRRNQVTTIIEEDESMVESSSLINVMQRTPYAGQTSSTIASNASGIGQLGEADNSVLLALQNFSPTSTPNPIDNDNPIARGHMSAGIGIFHGHKHDPDDDLIDEPERLIIYGDQRPAC